MRRGARASKTMRTELEQERRMATNDRFGDAAGEISRRMEDMSRRRKREALRNGCEWQSVAQAKTAD